MRPMTRREMLSEAAGFGLLVSAPVTLSALHGPTAPRLAAVVTDDPLGRSFAARLARTAEAVDAPEFTRALRDPASVRAAFAAYRDCTIVGLVGNDIYPVLQSLARDVGAAVLCHGRHVCNRAGSRHVFMTTPASEGMSAGFAAGLADDGAALCIEEHAIGETATTAAVLAARDRGPWIESLADVYTSLACGGWNTRWRVSVSRRGHQQIDRMAPVSVESFVMRL